MKISDIEVELVDYMGSDLSVVNAARVSFDKTSEWIISGTKNDYDGVVYQRDSKNLSQADHKLIKYLAKHEHKSPFNHTFVTVKVKAPVFVSRQLVKHKFMPWNEESRRYIKTEPEFYIPTEYRKMAENVKQGSSDELVTTVFHSDDITLESWESPIENSIQLHAEASLRLYNDLLAAGVCNEQARMVLPQNMMVNWMWSGTLGAVADMLVLRLDSHAQQETREVAEKVKDLIMPLFPVALSALLGGN